MAACRIGQIVSSKPEQMSNVLNKHKCHHFQNSHVLIEVFCFSPYLLIFSLNQMFTLVRKMFALLHKGSYTPGLTGQSSSNLTARYITFWSQHKQNVYFDSKQYGRWWHKNQTDIWSFVQKISTEALNSENIQYSISILKMTLTPLLVSLSPWESTRV